jgi:hypothetical protein
MSDNIEIKIISVEKETHPTQKGSYDSLEITYKNLTFQNKVESKKIVSFNHKEVFAVLSKASGGDTFTIQRSKNDKNYWDWVAVGGDAPQQGQAPAATGGKTMQSPKSTYETPEERAKKQVYIVRQSSINAAIALLKTDKKVPSLQEIMESAKVFESYVFGVDPAVNGMATPLPEIPEDDDVPY